MATITWITPADSIGFFPEKEYLEFQLDAVDSLGQSITYSLVNGILPEGLRLYSNGKIRGIPVIKEKNGQVQYSQIFIVQAANTKTVVTRRFTITILTEEVLPGLNWKTPPSLGAVAEGAEVNIKLMATDSSGSPLTYKIVSGTLGNGLQLSRFGELTGNPVIEVNRKDQDYTLKFTVRASSIYGKISDRTFTLIINSLQNPEIIPKDMPLGVFYDGYYLDLALNAVDPSPLAQLTWSVVSGTLPLGTTLSPDGKLSGYLLPYISEVNESAINWDKTGWNRLPWDVPVGRAQSRIYRFTVRVFDGAKYDESTYTLTVLAKRLFTVDSDIINVDTTNLTADLDNEHSPFITTKPQDLPTQRQNSNFAFKFDGFDIDADEIRFGLKAPHEVTFDKGPTSQEPWLDVIGFDEFGFDEQDQSLQGLFGIASKDVSLFDQGPSSDNPYVEVLTFDSFPFDKEYHSPNVFITLDPDTGWLTGSLHSQVEVSKTYTFDIFCYKKEKPKYFSKPVRFTLTVLGDLDNVIDWITPSFIGTIDNGEISEFKIDAIARLPDVARGYKHKKLRYVLNPGNPFPNNINPSVTTVKYTPQSFNRLPQGLRLLEDGLIVGRTTFAHFELDGNNTTFDKGTLNFDNIYTFTVMATDATLFRLDAETTTIDQGYTMFDSLWNSDSATRNPHVFDSSGGMMLTTYDHGELVIDSATTDFDHRWDVTKKNTTFDNTLTTFYELGTSRKRDATIIDTKVFQIKVNNYNAKPYERVYIRALPTSYRRLGLLSTLNNQHIFPDELIYRLNDPYFGKTKDLRFLFASGLNPTLMSEYIDAMQLTHFTKRVELGEIKTAVALDEEFNVKYEVVYVEVLDPGLSDGKSAPTIIDIPDFPAQWQLRDVESGDRITVAFNNSLVNMKSELTQIGYANQEVIPKWMSNQQEDGRVLGFIKACVLAYTVPGASKLISYRLKQTNINFRNVDFVIDRYQLDNYLTTYYDVEQQKYLASFETTFDRMPTVSDLYPFAGAVHYAVTVPFDQINNRTVNYIVSHGGVDGVTTFSEGDLLVFARQELFVLPPESDVGYVKDPFDETNFDSFGFNLDVYPEEYTSPNDGWNDDDGLYGVDLYDAEPYSLSTVVTGWNDKLLNPELINQRGGIWKIKITDGLVKLEFVQEVMLDQYVQVAQGQSYGGTKLYYNYSYTSGHTAPEYIQLTNRQFREDETTRFDKGSTRFYNNRDQFAKPDTNNKYLVFPKETMYH
jgi:hypothetical protein